jgi:myo-inositol 2-dehydrogenase / D-chiro-inositol 1-dehydrogenase
MKTVTPDPVGVGRTGAMHAKNVARLNHSLNKEGIQVRLKLTDTAEQHARLVAAEYATSVQALQQADLDGLITATGTAIHPELITQSVDAGIPVFCEKPVGVTVPESLPVLDYVREKNGTVQSAPAPRIPGGQAPSSRWRPASLFSTGQTA